MIIHKQEKDCIAITSSFIIKNEVVIIPTDTVYGFSGLYSAENTLVNIKKRDKNKSLIYLIEKPEQALNYIDTSFYLNVEIDFLLSFWPAPLTIIFKNKSERTIALRCPKDIWLNSLLSKIGSPIFSTSVNISGNPLMEKFEDIKYNFQQEVSLIVNDGDIKGESSTILDASKRPFKILRQGSYIINFDAILQEH
ncbi:MAG: L-threonylcarbamoyladenylate synthase [Treponema sp.]